MRDLLSKMMTGSMIAGAALLVAACGGAEEAEVENTTTELGTTDPMMDTTNTGDVTAIDGAAMGNDVMMDNMTMDANGATVTTTTTVDPAGNTATTNGM